MLFWGLMYFIDKYVFDGLVGEVGSLFVVGNFFFMLICFVYWWYVS